MSDRYEKKTSLLDRARLESGIYKLGFDPESGKGFMLPFIVVGAISVVVGGLIYFWL